MLIAYFQCANGVSGDMLLGALLDAGASVEAMNSAIDRVFPDKPIRLTPRETHRAGIRATHVEIQGGDGPVSGGPESRGHTSLSTLIERVETSGLEKSIREPSVRVLKAIGQAEARVHGGSPDDVELAELGAADTLVDVVGTVVGLEQLGIDAVHASGLPLATGRVGTLHGILPVPVPGVLELMRMAEAPTLPPPGDSSAEPTGEIVTPTGAAIITTLADFVAPPAMTSVRAVGYGAGTKDPPGRANIVTVTIGEAAEQQPVARPMVMVETTIDDMNPELYEHARERLIEAGARDVWLQTTQMKKGRPGVILTAIAPPETQAQIATVMLRETTTLGVRVTPVTRYEASRESVEVKTPLGPASVKVKRLSAAGEIIGIAPEYDDCRRIARDSSLPIQRVYEIVRRAAEDALL